MPNSSISFSGRTSEFATEFCVMASENFFRTLHIMIVLNFLLRRMPANSQVTVYPPEFDLLLLITLILDIKIVFLQAKMKKILEYK